MGGDAKCVGSSQLGRRIISEEDLIGCTVQCLQHMGERPDIGLGVADLSGVEDCIKMLTDPGFSHFGGDRVRPVRQYRRHHAKAAKLISESQYFSVNRCDQL
jgi:hypothetical protein